MRNDTPTNWSNENPVLLQGEMGVSVNGGKTEVKIGDGQRRWSEIESLPTKDYVNNKIDDALGAVTAKLMEI